MLLHPPAPAPRRVWDVFFDTSGHRRKNNKLDKTIIDTYMETPFISLGFCKLADANLVTKTDAIVAGMTGNANYPAPTPAIATVQTAAAAFQDALVAAADGGKVKTAQKNAAREVLLGLLRNLALYVQQNC